VAEGEAGRGNLQRLAPLRARRGVAVRRLLLLPDWRQRRVHGRLREPWTDAILAIADHAPARAADIFHKIGSLPNEARARLDAARQLVAQGRRSEAEAQLEQRLVFWRQVGATAYVSECEALLARAESA
jgi:hypothetical protein